MHPLVVTRAGQTLWQTEHKDFALDGSFRLAKAGNVWCDRSPQSSVAIAQANVFSQNGYSIPNKVVKILEIFDRIEELKSRGVIFWH
jgi:hypothetical protein